MPASRTHHPALVASLRGGSRQARAKITGICVRGADGGRRSYLTTLTASGGRTDSLWGARAADARVVRARRRGPLLRRPGDVVLGMFRIRFRGAADRADRVERRDPAGWLARQEALDGLPRQGCGQDCGAGLEGIPRGTLRTRRPLGDLLRQLP